MKLAWLYFWMLVHFSTTHFLPYPIADIHMNLLYFKNEGEFRKWLCSLEWLDCSEGQLAPSCFHKIEFPQTTCSLSVFPDNNNNNNNKKGRKLDWGKKNSRNRWAGILLATDLIFTMFLLWLNFRVQDLEVLGTTFSFNSLKIYITELHLLILPGFKTDEWGALRVKLYDKHIWMYIQARIMEAVWLISTRSWYGGAVGWFAGMESNKIFVI